LKNIINKPHLFFFALIPLFVIIGFVKRDIPININISYIYYLINVDFWCYITAVFFGLIGVNYLSLNWVKKYPNKWLTILHLILQVICVIPYLFAVFNLDKSGNFNNYNLFQNNSFRNILIISFLLFLASVFVHLINFFSSLLLRKD
jgi:hypothetical protein